MNIPDKIESIINDMMKFQCDLDRNGVLRPLLDRRTTRNKDVNKALDHIMQQISDLLRQVYIDKPPTTLSNGNSGDNAPIGQLNIDAPDPIANPENITAEPVILCEVPCTDTSDVGGGFSGPAEGIDQLSNTTIEEITTGPREITSEEKQLICSGERRALYALCRTDDITCIKIGQITGTPQQLMACYSTRYNPQGYTGVDGSIICQRHGYTIILF